MGRSTVMSGAVLTELCVALAMLLALVVLADATAAPRGRGWPGWRSTDGVFVLLPAASVLFGSLLLLTGAPILSAVSVATVAGALSLISNIKRRVLGEPLVFSDFALIGAVFRHPQFYLGALRPWQVLVLAAGLVGLAVMLAMLSTPALVPRLAGAILALVATVVLGLALLRLRPCPPPLLPDPDVCVRQWGLIATLLGHWRQWRAITDPAPCMALPLPGRSRQLVVIVQCESFTDPAELFGDCELALPGLERARGMAWQAGRLLVSGFGAYTMRTEYGVLFGRSEEQLGLRRFDPFLTAHGEMSWALANRLDPEDWETWFVHPHDLRFYGRDKLMPASGFGALVGREAFELPAPGEGRYVTDAAITERILELARNDARAGLIYAVTIENHGPWPAGDSGNSVAPQRYLDLLAHGDAMLSSLLDALPVLGRPVTLCFFGDHRPSIPGASEPGTERHTPYVLLRFSADGTPITREAGHTEDITPARLNRAILEAISLGETEA